MLHSLKLSWLGVKSWPSKRKSLGESKRPRRMILIAKSSEVFTASGKESRKSSSKLVHVFPSHVHALLEFIVGSELVSELVPCQE